ncbi:hypothetical protein KQI84_00670 [bacterium]|nr:hypothetical protein [bacterium]
MVKKFAAGILCVAAAATLSAQPYGWMMGSTADTPKTGNRLVVVDLKTQSVVGPASGWQYTNHSAGADPTAPSFSPNGDVAYVIVGGDGNASLPTGYMYLYDTDDVITKLGNSQTPDAPFQTLSYPSSDEDAVEPVGVTVAEQGDRVYVMEGKEQNLFVYDVQPDRTLTQVTVIDTGSGPGPFWLTESGDYGYFVNFEDFTVKAVNCRANPPAVTHTINVPPPTQNDSASQPGTFCSFPYPDGTSMTLLPPPGIAPTDSSKLLIYSGYYGFQTYTTIPFPMYILINDAYRVYSLDTATNTLDNSGSAIISVNPSSSEITFPPTLLSFEDSNGDTITHTAGSLVVGTNGAQQHLSFPAQDLMPIFGLRPQGEDALFIGSIPAANALDLAGGTYTPVRNTSMVLKYQPPSSRSALVATTNEYDVDRNMTIPLGFYNGKLVFGATDAYGLKGLPVPSGTLRDTKILVYDPVADSAVEIPTEIVGGAYAEQPLPGYDPTDTDGDGFTDQIEEKLGSLPGDPSSRPDFGDYDGDGLVNAFDGISMYRAAKSNGGTLTYDEKWDMDRDNDVDFLDAQLLLLWSHDRHRVIPTE